MLTQLIVQNFVLIDKLELSFDRSLSVFTGETGAGKSPPFVLFPQSDTNRYYSMKSTF